MVGSATVGGVLLALIEGFGIMVTRLQADTFAQHNTMYGESIQNLTGNSPTGKIAFYGSTPIPEGSSGRQTNAPDEVKRIGKAW